MHAVAARLQAGDHVHLWMRPSPGARVARLWVGLVGETHELSIEGRTRNPLPIDWTSLASGEMTLKWSEDDADVSLAYAFTPSRVALDGIRVLWTSPATTIDGARYRLHFKPPFGWINDPNGLCEIDGVTHLFYQHNPHGRRWNTMHWGHATSRDGIAWVHQPIAVRPRETLVRAEDSQGGIYSGTALPQPDGTMRLFYTDRDDSRVPAREWQMTAILERNLSAGPATILLDGHPNLPGYRNDWRDPFVFEAPDGSLRMLLGGADADGGVVLLYGTQDRGGLQDWRFLDVLFREASRRIVPAECPCMIRLDEGDIWVLIFGLIGSRDEATQRRNLVRTQVGHFDGYKFSPFYTHELDFGTDCYAMQVWRAADGPRGIAWAANWTDVLANEDFESAMTLPRQFIWREGRLFTPPIAAVDTLRAGPPETLAAGESASLGRGLAEIDLAIEPGTPLSLTFVHPTHGLVLEYDGRTLQLRYQPPQGNSTPQYRAECVALRSLRIFVDVGLIEIFVDGGAICCTKRIDSSLAIASVRLSQNARLESGRVWPLHALIS